MTHWTTIGDCKLACGDCLEILPELESGSVDAVVTDPPYGVDYGYKGHDDNREEFLALVPLWHKALIAACRGPVAVSCGIRNTHVWPACHWMLCWRKTFSVSRSPFGSNNWEPVLVYNKGRHGDRRSDYFEATFIHDKLAAQHPCPKPIAWANNIISIVSVREETILDPFMGSGTTGIACIRTGRKFIGIEKEPKYFDIACKRIENEWNNRQGKLFE